MEHCEYFQIDNGVYLIITLILIFIIVIIVTIIGYSLIFFFINISIMIVCQGLMILLFIWIRLWQARNYLRLISLKSNIDHIQRSLKKFIKFQRQTISLIILVDHFYSKSFLLIMLISLPINIFAIIELICGNAMKFIIIILALHEWLIIFALHLLIATINERIKLSNKQMFGILARTTTTKRIVTNHQPNSFYFNWNCNCYLQTMYTQIRPYGFTYGSISLVSMQSFVLVSALNYYNRIFQNSGYNTV